MRKFIIQSKKGKTSVMEVECELISALEDPSVMWLRADEWKAKILLPTSLHMKVEKNIDGKKEIILEPDVWCWHAFYSSLEEAQRQAADLICQEYDFNHRKYGKLYIAQDIKNSINDIEVVLL